MLITPIRLFPWFICLLAFLNLEEFGNIFAQAQTCSNLMFPLALGFSSGETEIFSMDQDSSTGYIYLAGTTTASELKVSGTPKSIFTALFNGQVYVWIKIINDPQVDTVEFMSAMGSTSENLVLYVTKSSLPYIPLILTMKKSDGSIVFAFDINDPTIG